MAIGAAAAPALCAMPSGVLEAPPCRMALTSSMATMMAGDSMRTRATAMWPPATSPCVSRNWLAVRKVTALTEP